MLPVRASQAGQENLLPGHGLLPRAAFEHTALDDGDVGGGAESLRMPRDHCHLVPGVDGLCEQGGTGPACGTDDK
jgi:hypothetical protein